MRTEQKLQAWWNGYEVVAAHSEEEARDVLHESGKTGGPQYDEEDLDGDGWQALNDEHHVKDEDGNDLDETIGDQVRKAGKPSHLWSCEV